MSLRWGAVSLNSEVLPACPHSDIICHFQRLLNWLYVCRQKLRGDWWPSKSHNLGSAINYFTVDTKVSQRESESIIWLKSSTFSLNNFIQEAEQLLGWIQIIGNQFLQSFSVAPCTCVACVHIQQYRICSVTQQELSRESICLKVRSHACRLLNVSAWLVSVCNLETGSAACQ